MPSFRVSSEPLDARTIRQRFEADRVLSYREVLEGWEHDEVFRQVFLDAIRSVPFGAVFWECRPLRASDLAAPFEHVLVESPRLAQVAVDEATFEEHFVEDEAVVSFENLGRDAVLVVPTPRPGLAYPHLLAFLRAAPEPQAHAVLVALGRAIAPTEAPRWVSTSGLGVYYVHLRIDVRPKYYVHAPYRRITPARCKGWA